jgi:uncharacterized protein YfaP (DUF2135 family)
MSVTIDGVKNIKAVFVATTYTLSTAVSGEGSITRSAQAENYPYGSSVTLTAVPKEGWKFSHWEGDASGSTNPLTYTVNSNKTINAVFVQISTLKGTVTDGQSITVLPGFTVNLRKGDNVGDGAVLATTSSDASGNYSFTNLEPGIYTLEVFGNGYVKEYFTVQCVAAQTIIKNTPVMKEVVSEEIRIRLTWGLEPRDLDSYLKTPDNRTICFTNKNQTGDPSLDIDKITGYGPETITIHQPASGTYKYWVHKFSGSGTLGTSGAKVTVYKGNNVVATFEVPAGQPGSTWNVFEIKDGVIIPINTLEP